MTTLDEIRKANATLRQALTDARGKLPPVRGLPTEGPGGFVSFAEVGEMLGLCRPEVDELLGGQEIRDDSNARSCIKRGDLDAVLVKLARGQAPSKFLADQRDRFADERPTKDDSGYL